MTEKNTSPWRFVENFWQRVTFFIHLLLLWREKRKSLFDMRCDIAFLEQSQNIFAIKEKIAQKREEMKQENIKDQGRKDQTKISVLSYEVATMESVKQSYDKMVETEVQLEQYIRLIKTWLFSV